LGTLSIYSADPFAFAEEEVKLLEVLASDLSFGIQTLRTDLNMKHRSPHCKLKLKKCRYYAQCK